MKLSKSQKVELEIRMLRLKAELEAATCHKERSQLNRKLENLCELLGIKLLTNQGNKKPPSNKRKKPNIRRKRAAKGKKLKHARSTPDSMVKVAKHAGAIRFVQGGRVSKR